MVDNPPVLGPDDCLHVAFTFTLCQGLDSNMRKKGSNNFPRFLLKSWLQRDLYITINDTLSWHRIQ